MPKPRINAVGKGFSVEALAARTKPRFIEIPRERGGVLVSFTEEQLAAMRGGLTAEEYRWKLIREWCEARHAGACEAQHFNLDLPVESN